MEAGVIPADLLRRSPRWTLEQVADLALQNDVGRQPDRIAVTLGFEELVNLRIGEGRVPSEIAPLHRASVARNHRLQHGPPAISRMDISGPQGTSLQIAELVEHEQRMITGAGKMPIIGAAFLCAVGRTFA